MSEKLSGGEQVAPSTPDTNAVQASSNEAMAAAPERLEGIEEIDFLLEEIESKIAPLALA